MLVLFTSGVCFAQDVIYKTDGTEINAKIIEVTPDMIKYKLYNFQDGPVYNIYISDVYMIIYENGRKEMYSVKKEFERESKPEIPVSEKEIKKDPSESEFDGNRLKERPGHKRSNRLRLGLSAGINASTGIFNYNVGSNPPFESFQLAPTGGLNIELPITPWLALGTFLGYKGKGYRISMADWAASFEFPQGISVTTSAEGDGFVALNLGYIEWSLYPTVYVNSKKSDNRFFLSAGPYVAAAVHGKEKSDYTINYYYNDNQGNYNVFEQEQDIVNKEKPVEFVNLIPGSNDSETFYANRIDYGLYFSIGIQYPSYVLGAGVSYGLTEIEPDSGGLFSSYRSITQTNLLTGTLYLIYYF